MINLKNIIKDAEYVIITAGAGMGVDSGLPDFRGDKGLWNTESGEHLSFIQLASPKLFKENLNLAWKFYGNRFKLYKETKPHEGFEILKNIVAEKEYFIFTSNVDGHFQKAGFSDDKIMECHGTINYFQCVDICSRDIWKGELNENIPKCIHCDKAARPNILMFGDDYWIEDRTKEQEQKLSIFLNNMKDKKGIIIEIGAGEEIPTVRVKGETIALRKKIPLIRINPTDLNCFLPILYFPLKKKGLEGIKSLI